MAFEQTANGLNIQSLAELIAEFEGEFRDPVTGWGAGAQLAPNSAFGQIIGIISE